MIKIAKLFKENHKKIENIQKMKDKDREEFTAAHNKIRDIYWGRRKDLDKEEGEKIEAMTNTYNEKKNGKNQVIEQLHQVIAEVGEIVAFLKIDIMKDISIPDNIDTYHDTFVECIGYLFDGDFLKIKAFIFINDKPKNKYSLIFLGKTVFHDSVLNLHYSYGLPSFKGEYEFKLRVIIKDMPTIDELKKYFDRLKDKLRDKHTVGYQENRQKYDDIISKYKLEDFKEIMHLMN